MSVDNACDKMVTGCARTMTWAPYTCNLRVLSCQPGEGISIPALWVMILEGGDGEGERSCRCPGKDRAGSMAGLLTFEMGRVVQIGLQPDAVETSHLRKSG